MSQAWLRASAFVWILTVWGTGALYPGNALGQQSKTVEIPGDAYTAYEVPPGGAALQLTINRANTRLVIDDTEIQLQDTSDTVQWSRSAAGPAAHVFNIDTVLSARE